MKVTSEKTGPCEYLLNIEVESERLTKPLRQAAHRLSKRRPLSGFRPGKAPYELVELTYGKAIVYDEMLNSIGDKLYQEALEEAKIEPYDRARFEIDQLEPLTLKITVPTQPQVTLGDYRKIKVKQAKPRVTKKEIAQALEQMREEDTLWVPVERATQMGDQIVIDAKGVAADNEDMEQNDLTLEVTEALMPAEFRSHLLGILPEETKEFDVKYPEDFRDSNLAGKQFHFRVLVRSVKEKELPALDDEWAQSRGDYETLDDLRKDIKGKLQQSKRARAKESAIEEAVSALVEQATLEYPGVAVEHEASAMLKTTANRLSQEGFTLESYLNTTGRTLEQFREEIRPQAETRLRRSLVLAKLADAEGVTLEKEDLDREIDHLSAEFGEQAEAVKDALRREAVLRSMTGDLYSRKVVEHLLALATGQAVPRADQAEEAQEAESEAQETTEDAAA